MSAGSNGRSRIRRLLMTSSLARKAAQSRSGALALGKAVVGHSFSKLVWRISKKFQTMQRLQRNWPAYFLRITSHSQISCMKECFSLS